MYIYILHYILTNHGKLLESLYIYVIVKSTNFPVPSFGDMWNLDHSSLCPGVASVLITQMHSTQKRGLAGSWWALFIFLVKNDMMSVVMMVVGFTCG